MNRFAENPSSYATDPTASGPNAIGVEQLRRDGSLRHLLTLEGLSLQQLEMLLDRAQGLVRTLGKAHYGQWSTTFIVIGLIAFFSTFGIEEIAIREAAREPDREFDWLGSVMMVRIILLGPITLAALAAVVALHESQEMLIGARAVQGIGASKVERLLRLARRAQVITVVDSWEGAQAISNSFARSDQTIEAFLEVDIGYHRCGVSAADALDRGFRARQTSSCEARSSKLVAT